MRIFERIGCEARGDAPGDPPGCAVLARIHDKNRHFDHLRFHGRAHRREPPRAECPLPAGPAGPVTVRAENLIRGSEQHSCGVGGPAGSRVCGRSAGRDGRAPPPGGTTCGYAVSPSSTPVYGLIAARDTGGLLAPGSFRCSCPMSTGTASACCLSPRPGSVSIRRLDEPLDAGPHVRWCGRGQGDPAPYPLMHQCCDVMPGAGHAALSRLSVRDRRHRPAG
jgi:hypothetical protein